MNELSNEETVSAVVTMFRYLVFMFAINANKSY